MNCHRWGGAGDEMNDRANIMAIMLIRPLLRPESVSLAGAQYLEVVAWSVAGSRTGREKDRVSAWLLARWVRHAVVSCYRLPSVSHNNSPAGAGRAPVRGGIPGQSVLHSPPFTGSSE